MLIAIRLLLLINNDDSMNNNNSMNYEKIMIAVSQTLFTLHNTLDRSVVYGQLFPLRSLHTSTFHVIENEAMKKIPK